MGEILPLWAPFRIKTGRLSSVEILKPVSRLFFVMRRPSDPITNQYWRVEDGIPFLYQQFENGYVRCEDGEAWFGDFHNKIDEGEAYVEPPEAPPAYGDIYTVNADGCSWENPKYIPIG